MIKKSSIELVLDTVKIEDIVGSFVDLRQRGVNLLGLCPFHDEKTPSFTVSPTKNIYKCFGCGKAGNAVRFLQDHEQYGFIEAIRYIADRYNIQLEETENSADFLKDEKERESLYIINQHANEFFVNQLNTTEEGRQIAYAYLKQRGYLKKSIDEFELGYLSKSGKELHDFAKKKGLNLEKMREMGLFTQSGYDNYRNRIIFPIHNLSGKVIGFGARTLSENKKTPKYLNSPETEIYDKSKVLYGIFQARKRIRELSDCILVEGYTDVISLHQGGLNNVVSSSGTSLTEGQIRLIKRFSEQLTMLFDGDEAGIKAAKRGLPLVLKQGLNLNIVILPDGQDPDSYLKEMGADAIKRYINDNKKDFLIQLLEWNYSKQSSPVEKSKGLQEVLEHVALIFDTLKRSFYLQEIAIRTNIAEEVLVKRANKIISERLRNSKNPVRHSYEPEASSTANGQSELGSENPIIKSEDSLAKHLCHTLLLYGDTEMEWDGSNTYVSFILLEELKPVLQYIKHPIYAQMIRFSQSIHAQSLPVTHRAFTRSQDEQLAKHAIDLIQTEYQMSKNWEEKYDYPLQSQPAPEENLEAVVKELLLRFKLITIQRLSAENKEKIKEMGESDDWMELMNIHLQLEKEKMNVASELKSVIISKF